MLIVQSPSIRHALAASRWLWLVLVLAGLTAVLTVSQPFVVQRIIDAALTQQALTPHVLTYAVLAMSVPILQWLITSLASHTACCCLDERDHPFDDCLFGRPHGFYVGPCSRGESWPYIWNYSVGVWSGICHWNYCTWLKTYGSPFNEAFFVFYYLCIGDLSCPDPGRFADFSVLVRR